MNTPVRLSRVWAGRQARRQKTLTHENTILQDKSRGEKITIKNLMYYVRLKKKVSQLANDLSSRRWKTLKYMHFKQISDKAFYPSEESKRRLGYYSQEKSQEEENNDGEQEKEEKFNQLSVLKQLSMHYTSRSARVLGASKDFLVKIRMLIDLIPVFDPNSVSKLLWDSFYNILGLILSIIAPLKLAIQEYQLSYFVGSSLVLGLMIIIIILDMITNLNTAFFKRGKIQRKRYAIFKNYMSQMGVCDALITQALIWELWAEPKTWMEQAQNVLLCLLLYYKALKLHKLMFKIEETFSFNRRTLNMLSLAKLLIFILKISHAFACLWVFIGRQMVAGHNSSWMSDWKDDGWATQYLQAYYFISVTMTTIGFGDIVPKNPVETVVCIFSMILACVIFGYTINIIGSIFMELKKEDEAKKENLLIINRYMNEKGISRDLQSSIREYLEYFWKQQSNDNSDKEAHILEQLSEDMRQALLIQANRIILEDCQFFKRHFSRDSIQKSVHLIRQKKLTPYEPIINSYDDQAKNGHIFFVESGEIDIYQEFQLEQMTENQTGIPAPVGNDNEDQAQNNNIGNHVANQNPQNNANGQPILAPPIPLAILQLLNGVQQTPQSQMKTNQKHLKKVKTLTKGDFFGEYSFFTNFPNSFIAKSRNFSKILYIERSKFLEYLQLNNLQEDLETFHNIKDNLVQNQMASLFVRCHYCSSYDHSPLICPTVHYIPTKMNVINRYNFSSSITERKHVHRRKVEVKNCRAVRQKNEEIQEIYERKNRSFIFDHFKHNSQSEDSDDLSNSSDSSQDDSDSQSDPEDDNLRRERHDTAAAVAAITHPRRIPSSNNYFKQNQPEEKDDDSSKDNNNSILEEDDDDLLPSEGRDDLLPTYKRDSFMDHLNRRKPNLENDDNSNSEALKFQNQTFSEVVGEEQDSPTVLFSKEGSPALPRRRKQISIRSNLISLKKRSYPRLILPGDPDHKNIADSLENHDFAQTAALPVINISEIDEKNSNNTDSNITNNFNKSKIDNQQPLSGFDKTPAFVDSYENKKSKEEIVTKIQQNSASGVVSSANITTTSNIVLNSPLTPEGKPSIEEKPNNQANQVVSYAINPSLSSTLNPPPSKQNDVKPLIVLNVIPASTPTTTLNTGSPPSPVPQRLLSKHFLDPKKSKGNFLDPQNFNRFQETPDQVEPMKTILSDPIPPESANTLTAVSGTNNPNKLPENNQNQDNFTPANDNEIHLKNIKQTEFRSKFLRSQSPSTEIPSSAAQQEQQQQQQQPKSSDTYNIKINEVNNDANSLFPIAENFPKRFLSIRSEDPKSNYQPQQSPQQSQQQTKRRESVLSHSFNFRSSFLSQQPLSSQAISNRKPSVFQSQLSNQSILNAENSMKQIRRLSMAYFASPEDRLKFGLPKVNNAKPTDTASPVLSSQFSPLILDHSNRQQRIQAAIAKTIEKCIEEEGNQLGIVNNNNSNQIPKPGNLANGEDQANKLMMFIDQQNQQQLQLTETLYQNWDVEFDSAFESMKTFKNYFPSYNFDKVLQRIKRRRYPAENGISKLFSRYQRSNYKKSNTIISCNLKDKDGSISPIKEPVTMKHERSNYREFSSSSNNNKMPSLTLFQSDLEIPTSPSNTNTQLLTVNINRKAKFQPFRNTVTSPKNLKNPKLLNKVSQEDQSPGFSDDEFQELQRRSPNGVFVTKQSLKAFLP